MATLNFSPQQLPSGAPALRARVRSFVNAELGERTLLQRVKSWSAFDPHFSRRLGRQGWIGMTWPAKYGGADCSALERYVVLEELLAAGAPVGAHWIADRQSGPLLLKYGTEEQKTQLLPAMARGESYFCIGMSEASAGSDLAALRTRALPEASGWRLNGSKLWTTNADRAHYMIALVRTHDATSSRHQGLSQLLVDLKSPGISIVPITDLAGERHFNEVFFHDVFVPETMLIGAQGAGWQQVTSELALERSGPERYLSSFCLLDAFVSACGEVADEGIRDSVGTMLARLWTMRQMSISIAGQLATGREPALEAAIVKDLGTELEQDVPALIQALADTDLLPDESGGLREALDYLLQLAPSFSLRGGTREILRGIIAKRLGLP